MSVYLGSEHPRWQPHDEAEIRRVIDEGLLRETHYLDVKREVAATDGERKNIARHLASLAIDGGALLVGVEELKQERTWRLAPQPLDGLAERVEQIATHLIDPPLSVHSIDIPTPDDPSVGYLFIEVPATANAPHMVDGIYFGRGDRTRTRLSDAEVLRLHTRHEPLDRLAEQLLDVEVKRDHVPAGERQSGRLYAVAQPLTAQRRLAVDLLASDPTLREIVESAEGGLDRNIRDFSPEPHYASQFARLEHGAALCSFRASGPGRTMFHRGRRSRSAGREPARYPAS